MNLTLVNCFKNSCDGRLKELIDRCYLFIDAMELKRFQKCDYTYICNIYTPADIREELINYQYRLECIGDRFKIDWVYLIPIDRRELSYLKKQAEKKGSLEAWKIYLELQYIFSDPN
ncbi:MAG: hypothetical protein QNJ38_21660 [Prochloraceae cyanobacterium]|nr:hypothetical protein [Prochloraceae cyanobacterium]